MYVVIRWAITGLFHLLTDEIIKEIDSLNANSNQLDICLTSGGMHYSHKYFFDTKKNLVDRQMMGEHKGIRYVTKINNENVKVAKLYLDSGLQIKHLSNLPPLSFGVSDKKIAVTIEKMEEGKEIQSLLVSNEPKYLKHFSAIPVMKLLSSEARNKTAFATSSGLPIRPRGMPVTRLALIWSSL